MGENINIQLFPERLSDKMCTRQSRKVIRDMMDTLFLTTVAVEPTFVPFRQHSQTHFHGLSCQFFQISLKNSELKTTHNAFQDCRVHFFRQPFSKQLYTLQVFELQLMMKKTCKKNQYLKVEGLPVYSNILPKVRMVNILFYTRLRPADI